ncbi:MAG: T9SS type A sorting domain-containing protein [bacterium]
MDNILKYLQTIVLLVVLGFASPPHVLRQLVRNWPVGLDQTGTYWMIYDLNHATTHWFDQDTTGSYTTYSVTLNAVRWTAEIGVFPDWQDGDTIIAFGSWDSAYAGNPGTYDNNIDHTGFYWLYSDTLDESMATQSWSPDDTVWVMPKIDVTKTGPGGGANDTIWFEFSNPKETRRADQTEYDVFGYWLFADTTGTGTPNAFNAGTVMDLGVIPVDGVFGDTTVHWMLESDGFEAWQTWTVYFAYKIIARPDTTADNIGYSTYYFSQNSDPTIVYQNVIAVKENQSIGFDINKMEVSPNPSRGNFNIIFDASGTGYAILRLYDVLGRDTGVLWQGDVKNGSNSIDIHGQSKGVYFLMLESRELEAKQKIVID